MLVSGLGHDHDTHDSTVWLGLVAAVAMVKITVITIVTVNNRQVFPPSLQVGFFVFEKVVTVLGEWREGRRGRERKVRVVREGHKPSSKAIGEVKCHSKYRSAGCCYTPTLTNPFLGSPHCINDFDLDSGEEAKGEDCQEQRELRAESLKVEPLLGPEKEHDTVIISEHEVTFVQI